MIAPDLSCGVAGTQEGAVRKMRNGTFLASSSMYSMPFIPMTLAISCGSDTTAVVPWGTVASAKREGQSWEDSMWMWASTSPGSRKCFGASGTEVTETNLPSSMSTLAG